MELRGAKQRLTNFIIYLHKEAVHISLTSDLHGFEPLRKVHKISEDRGWTIDLPSCIAEAASKSFSATRSPNRVAVIANPRSLGHKGSIPYSVIETDNVSGIFFLSFTSEA